ncbi:MAG: AMP-binding protein, partial [Gemmatimonas sp.]
MNTLPTSGTPSSASADAIPLWIPTSDDIERARVTTFLRNLHALGAVPETVSTMYALREWSVQHPERFWQEVWNAAGIVASPRPDGSFWEQVLVNGDRMQPPHGNEGPQWFTGASLNFAENLLSRRDEHVAIVAWTEQGRQRRITYRELAQKVAQTRAAMLALGVTVGDRVVGYLPNIPEAVIAMLAATSIGAVWSSCSPDFGFKGVLDRFGQIEPKLLIVANGYRYAGKIIDCRERNAEVRAALPSLAALWEVTNESTLGSTSGARSFEEVIDAHDVNTPLEFARLPFNHPVYILYSSGTTGLPKCLVHGAGGTLLQHWKEQALHTDIGRDDVFFYFTTCGWMMWNWFVSGLMLGATVVLYDGAPLAPDARVLLRMAHEERITIFGISAKYLAVLEKEDPQALGAFDLRSLRAILSTGSPLAANSYD